MPVFVAKAIISDVEVRDIHRWDVSVADAQRIQRGLADSVVRRGRLDAVELIAGIDISGADEKGMSRGAIVVLRYPSMEVVEVGTALMKIEFPYVPGLLSFREIPLVLAACRHLSTTPDLFIADGQGIAHPRRLGLASHLGLLLEKSTIGCAKSRLIGEFAEPGAEKGAWSPLRDGDGTIGAVVRTRSRVRPVFVSVGHKCTLEDAIRVTVACATRYRIPEPARLAHQAVSKLR